MTNTKVTLPYAVLAAAALPAGSEQRSRHLRLEAVNSLLNFDSIAIERNEESEGWLNATAEALVGEWYLSTAELGLPDDASDEQIRAALLAVIRDWLWVHLVDHVDSLFDNLDDLSRRFTKYGDGDIATVRTVRQLRAEHRAGQ